MSSKTKKQPQPTAPKPGFQWPPYTTHILAFVVYLLLTIAYFYPQIEGKIILQGDILGWQGMAKESMDHYKKTGEIALWSNSMFGGMPTFQTNNLQTGNYLQYVLRGAGLYMGKPIGVFLGACLFGYLMLVLMGVRSIAAWLGGFAFAFTTNHLILLEAGHDTKLLAISTFPVIIAGMYTVFQRKYVLGGLLFALGMGMSFYANHVQMTYFLGITLAFYTLSELVFAIKEKAFKHIAISGGVLLVALLLGVGSSTGKLWTTYEYGKDTMRGEPILTTEGEAQKSSETNGLEWNYAMQWSQGPMELFTLMIPGVAGGSSGESIGKDSETRKALSRMMAGVPANMKVPLYWGRLPFTSGPIYAGVIVVFLFLMGMLLEDNRYKWWILAGVVFTLLFSMGKNLESFNRLVFDYLPMMNKFRTPNSVLSVTPVLMVLLGGMFLKNLFDGKYESGKVTKSLYIAAGSMGAVALYFALIGPGAYDFTAAEDARLADAGYPMDAIKADRASLMQSDAIRSLIFLLLSAGALFFWNRKKLSGTIALLALAGLTVIDLWGVNTRYLGHDDFVSPKANTDHFTPRAVDEAILADTDLSYRVFDVTVNSFNSSFASYFHKSIGGYHAAKLQRYQDIIDRYLTRDYMPVQNMLNTRYVIFKPSQDADPRVFKNEEALGNAWLVNEVQFVPTANAEIDGLDEGFDPATTAIVHESFKELIPKSTYSAEGTITLTEYSPNKLTYRVSGVSEEQLAVFSEIWYGPNKGWKVTIDGKEQEHFRVNYILRGLLIPANAQEIVFSFEPRSHFLGQTISRMSSGLILLGAAGYLAFLLLGRGRERSLEV